MARHVAPVSPAGLYAEAIELGHITARLQDGGEHVPALVAEQEATKHIRATKTLASRLGLKRVEVRAHPGGRRLDLDRPIKLGTFAEAVGWTLIDTHYEQEREGTLLSIN